MQESLSDAIVTLAEANMWARVGSLLSGLDAGELGEFRVGWQRLSVEQRESLVKTLVSLSEDQVELDFRPIFRWLLSDSSPEVRAAAVEGLWEDQSRALIGPFLHLMHHDPDARVRAAAAISLGRYVLGAELGDLDQAEAVPIVEALLQTVQDTGEDLEVRRRALESLAYASEPVVRDLIEAAYYHSDTGMQASAVFAMGRSADPAWEPFVLAELDSPESELRYEAALAAGELELLSAVHALANLLHDEDVDVQLAAIEALGRIGGSEAERLLLSLAASGTDVLVAAAEEALAELHAMTGFRDLQLLDWQPSDVEDWGDRLDDL